MKKSLLILSFLVTTISLNAQSISGIATYKTAASISMEIDSTSEFGVDQQQMFQKMIAESMRKEYELQFSRTESLYKEIEALQKDDGRRFGAMFSSMNGATGILYKNLVKGNYSEQKEFFSKIFLIKDTMQVYDWKLGKETKSIGKYTCYKATAEKITRTFQMDRMRNRGAEVFTQDTTMVTAWYTMQIPVNNGPGLYNGLPGLIMEVNDGNMMMLCTKVVLNPEEPVEIEAPKKGEIVTSDEYQITVEEKIQEMNRSFGNGERRGPPPGRMR